MNRLLSLIFSVVVITAATSIASAQMKVTPGVYDPQNTFLATAFWFGAMGCPTNSPISTNGTSQNGFTMDAGCPTGDSSDLTNQALVLVKTGPTGNYAAGLANVTGFGRINITEIGYDIRKAVGITSANGSHCGAGAPRFDITTTDNKNYFLGCNSPAPTTVTVGTSWLRLRWTPGISGHLQAYNASTFMLEDILQPVKTIQIVFDEGSDTGPDFFGIVVLDNIDINGTLIGSAGAHSTP